MKNLPIIHTCLAVLALFTACEKKPVASFTADKEVYRVLDTVHLTNTSTNADSYEWSYQSKSVYDNVKSTSTDLSFVITNMNGFYSVNKGEGYIGVNLTARSKSGKKTNYTKKNLPLAGVPIKGISFWTKDSIFLNVEITDGGNPLIITKLSTTKPTQPYLQGATAGFRNYPGVYDFTFKKGTSTWIKIIVMNRDEEYQLYELK